MTIKLIKQQELNRNSTGTHPSAWSIPCNISALELSSHLGASSEEFTTCQRVYNPALMSLVVRAKPSKTRAWPHPTVVPLENPAFGPRIIHGQPFKNQLMTHGYQETGEWIGSQCFCEPPWLIRIFLIQQRRHGSLSISPAVAPRIIKVSPGVKSEKSKGQEGLHHSSAASGCIFFLKTWVFVPPL